MKNAILRTHLLILGWLAVTWIHSSLHATVHYSVGNGDWSSATTWSTSSVPSGSDSIVISHLVVLDQTINLSRYLRVELGATLEKSGNSQDINLLPGGWIDDYGRMICRNFANSGTLNVYNDGLNQYYFEASNNFDNNAGGIVNNWGWMEIHTLTNLIGGEIYNNTPVGTISITNKLDNSGLIDNDWIVSITGNLINNQGILQGNGGSYFCTPTFTNNAGASVDCNGAPINICRPNGTYPVVNGSGSVNIACVLLCNGPWPPALAINLVSFVAWADAKDNVVLDWVSASEVNAHRYEVERRTSDSDFTMIGFMEAARLSHETRSYRMVDTIAPKGALQYRLKMVDYDGSYIYSPVIDVTVPSSQNALVVYPNPATGFVTFKTDAVQDNKSNVLIRQSQGNVVRIFPVEAVDGRMLLRADISSLPNGTYTLEYLNGVQRKIGKLVVIH